MRDNKFHDSTNADCRCEERCGQPRIIPEDEAVIEHAQLMKVLNQISFAPSCVDMAWAWNVEPVLRRTKPDETMINPAGWLISTTFQRPDRETGKSETGEGRKWFIARGTTVSGVVKTCFAACRMILEHELMESFKWKHQRVFDPHNTVQELARLNPWRYTDSIP